jgi:hypothetical protein
MPKNIWIRISNIAKKYEKQDNYKLLDRKEKDRSERVPVRYLMLRARYQHQYGTKKKLLVCEMNATVV